MTTVAIYLTVVFGLGAVAHLARLPPLIGFLAAGFILHSAGVPFLPELTTLSNLGVTLMLFGVGLHLDLRTLLGREVWAAGSMHLVVSAVAGAAALWVLAIFGLQLNGGEHLSTVVLVAFALTFSSTVLVIKLLEERGDAHSLYGRVAVGILVLQDIVAVIYLTASSGHLPSVWALAVLALLWPVTRLGRALWTRLGHGELVAMFGLVMALVPGYWAFTATGLKGDLGALIVGVLLASHSRSADLARSLFTIKDLLLVAFFVSIGFNGLPSFKILAVAVLLCAMVPLQSAAMAAALTLCGLRHRTATRCAVALANYSEFALIVAATAVAAGALHQDWLVMLACAVALSFVFGTIINRRGSQFTEWILRYIPERAPENLHPDDRPLDLERADVLVLGMGAVGKGAYDEFVLHTTHTVVGVDNDPAVVARLRNAGYDVENADATDADAWDRIVTTGHVQIAVLAMPVHESNVDALAELTDSEFSGHVAAVARFADQAEELKRLGVDTVIDLHSGAGLAVAYEAQDDLDGGSGTSPVVVP